MGQLATHTGGIVSIHMSRPGAFFFKIPLNFKSALDFLESARTTELHNYNNISQGN